MKLFQTVRVQSSIWYMLDLLVCLNHFKKLGRTTHPFLPPSFLRRPPQSSPFKNVYIWDKQDKRSHILSPFITHYRFCIWVQGCEGAEAHIIYSNCKNKSQDCILINFSTTNKQVLAGAGPAVGFKQTNCTAKWASSHPNNNSWAGRCFPHWRQPPVQVTHTHTHTHTHSHRPLHHHSALIYIFQIQLCFFSTII